jgi:hypothetical protein
MLKGWGGDGNLQNPFVSLSKIPSTSSSKPEGQILDYQSPEVCFLAKKSMMTACCQRHMAFTWNKNRKVIRSICHILRILQLFAMFAPTALIVYPFNQKRAANGLCIFSGSSAVLAAPSSLRLITFPPHAYVGNIFTP